MEVSLKGNFKTFLFIMLAVMTLNSCDKEELCTSELNPPTNSDVNLNDSLPSLQYFYPQLEEPTTQKQFRCIVLLPDSVLFSAESPLPVLYLLHGKDSAFTGWKSDGKADNALKAALARGIVPPMAIVMPEALNTYYVNGYQDSIMYEDYFFQTFIPYIEGKYNLGGCKENRWIAGNSMGGYGALYYSIKHNDHFSLCYAMSARATGPLSPIVPDLLNCTSYPQDVLFFLDIGRSDQFLQQNLNLFQRMIGYDVTVSLQVSEGGHHFTFWRSALDRCLEQVGRLKI
jgi:enterochelin esterase-like enzyme